MILAIAHPEVASRDCEDCLRFVYNDDPSHAEHGQRVMVRGEPLKRTAQVPTLCQLGRCPKGTPEESRELSEANRQAWSHYRRCRAVGRFPDDPVVARNAEVIESAEAEAAAILREREREQHRRNGRTAR